jgi:hypothetical protein
VANSFISPFKTQTMHIKSFYTQQHLYVSIETLYPGGIRTRVFLFLRRMTAPHRRQGNKPYLYLTSLTNIT